MLIKNGRLINPKTFTDEMLDVRIEAGRIVKIGKLSKGKDERMLDARGRVVAPGLVDVHVHFRDPGFTYKEDIASGCTAAARGGFTSVVCMANTKPIVDNEQTLALITETAKKMPIHVFQAAAISKGFGGEELTDMARLLELGAIGFTDDGIPLRDGVFTLRAMECAKSLGAALSFHEEDPAFITNNGINHGRVSEQLGLGGSPAVAENVLVARDCMLALATGARVSIQHISSGASVDLVRMARARGADVWAEATPHHFSLTEDAVITHGSYAKMNPPLRTEQDRREIIAGLCDGTIAIIATDHAPHSAEEKAKPLHEAPSGIIGLETALALGVTNLVRPGHLTLSELVARMSPGPADFYNLDAGELREGGPADIVIFDPEEAFTVSSFASKSSNSPFLRERLFGKVLYTICGGAVVYDTDSI